MPSARETALQALTRFRRDGAWPDLYLKEACAGLRGEEAALAAALTYGVLENRAWLDFLLSRFCSRPLEKQDPRVLDVLRLGACQLVLMERIPPRAAVNETVELAKKSGCAGAAPFVNGVLRSLDRSRGDLPQVPREDVLTYLSTRYSHPRWFVGKMRKRLGDEGCEALLRADNGPADTPARVNTLKITRGDLLARMEEAHIPARPHPFLENALLLDDVGAVLRSGLLDEGLLYIQDTASQLCMEALAPQPGEDVLDLCAAPGGKSLLAGQKMKNRGTLRAWDLYPARAARIGDNARRYGVSILTAGAADASVLRPGLRESADAIICDVPCSGMGVIRKKPDIRYKDGDSIKVLPPLQYAILCAAGEYLRPGGRLVYSTCTLLREENEQVTARFLAEHPGFALKPFALPGIGETPGEITFWPHIHGTDGFYMAKITKQRG
ncbi:MAG: 16S rRNA (cytosine(967)-C(5))-methyltransferase RsmB [Clostridia bacterium]|nr:16S rRNA (cytosine(967)-C(5))-methyltransferase RsmB [Clostridia bacterium]MDD7672820.1 16S rRNA (cytosine(967)-C(5))-methyltransferase RsmB [Clostridia bacterium]MDY2929190.1 16S rRNA (cytosine(967)-C(5))-methyltransferase RsmB [Clostridiaceae bacterium]